MVPVADRQCPARSNATGSNPFARKPAADANSRNPVARTADVNKSLHKSESFFNKVDAAETDKSSKRGAGKGKGKEKEKKDAGRQTTLFGLPTVQPGEKDKKVAGGRKKKVTLESESQDSGKGQDTQTDTQTTDAAMDEGQSETIAIRDTQVDEEQTQPEDTQVDNDMDTEVYSSIL